MFQKSAVLYDWTNEGVFSENLIHMIHPVQLHCTTPPKHGSWSSLPGDGRHQDLPTDEDFFTL